MGTAGTSRLTLGEVVEIDGEEFACVACDDCGAAMLTPSDMEGEVNYCRACSPVTEDYDPSDEPEFELVSEADDDGIEIGE